MKGMMIKLDLPKAYDRLSWPFRLEILKSFGFDSRWTDWISSMISSLVISILINDSISMSFNPSWAIHQGDLLSPFLFILVAEGLGRYIKATI